LIKGIVDNTILMKGIGFKPSSESGIPVLMPLKSVLNSVPINVKDNWLLLGKMDRKAQNTGLMILNLKEIKAPGCLTAANITRIQIVLDLILSSAKLHGGTIVALVHILVDVLDGFDRGNGLHIDVTPVLPDEILAVTDNPSVVNPKPVAWPCKGGLPSVETSCPRIGVFSDCGTLIKGLREAFRAHTVLHARGILILSTAGTMDHELFDQLKQVRIVHRKLRGHEAVNLLWGTQLGMWLQKDNDVCMRKAPLLELNGIKEAINVTKDTLLNVLYERVKLHMKDTCDHVRTLSS
jgi:hypothetical protein